MKLNLKNDIVFKAFFGRKGNEKFLKEEKGGRLDLLATLNDGIDVNIEMQMRKTPDFLERTGRYSAKLLSRQQR